MALDPARSSSRKSPDGAGGRQFKDDNRGGSDESGQLPKPSAFDGTANGWRHSSDRGLSRWPGRRGPLLDRPPPARANAHTRLRVLAIPFISPGRTRSWSRRAAGLAWSARSAAGDPAGARKGSTRAGGNGAGCSRPRTRMSCQDRAERPITKRDPEVADDQTLLAVRRRDVPTAAWSPDPWAWPE